MRTKVFLICLFLLSLSSCVSNEEHKKLVDAYELLQLKNDSLKRHLELFQKRVKSLSDSVSILSYPAEQRFNAILEYVKAEDFDKAKHEINSLKSIFPKSKEANECKKQLEIIEKKIAEKKAEEERIKALGFKAIKQRSTFEVEYNKITLSGISIGKTFVFDAYGNEWHYYEADRGSKYVTAKMVVKSLIHLPDLPEFAIYKIKGDEMIYEGAFMTRYARWDDYSSYLGNEPDFNNDFSKTSTVSFKLGVQVEEDITKHPFAIVAVNKNTQEEKYDRFANPPKSWSRNHDFPSTLKIVDFEDKYILVKILNMK